MFSLALSMGTGSQGAGAGGAPGLRPAPVADYWPITGSTGCCARAANAAKARDEIAPSHR
jgi:hypothetical protein